MPVRLASPRRSIRLVLSLAAAAFALGAVAARAEVFPPAEMVVEVDQATETFFAHYDAGRAAEAHAMMSQKRRGMTPLPALEDEIESFRADAGRVRERRVTDIEWHDRRSGPLAIVSFSGRTEFADVYCGILVWRLLDVSLVGAAQLERADQNFIDRDTARAMTANGWAEFRKLRGCGDAGR